MRAITIWQPWADLIRFGFKQYETRGHKTNIRGTVAIHAAKRPLTRSFKAYAKQLWIIGFNQPDDFGGIVAVADLVDCVPVDDLIIDHTERSLGDFTAGRFAWKFENVNPIRMVEIAGKQGWWNCPQNVDELLARKL